MQYMLLIYSAEEKAAEMSPQQMGALHGAYRDFTRGIVQSGQFKAGDALERTATATTVRVRNGTTLMTDGPFAETHEQLAGYYLIEAANLDEATAIAARVPSAAFGSIEVRPVRVMTDM